MHVVPAPHCARCAAQHPFNMFIPRATLMFSLAVNIKWNTCPETMVTVSVNTNSNAFPPMPINPADKRQPDHKWKSISEYYRRCSYGKEREKKQEREKDLSLRGQSVNGNTLMFYVLYVD